MASRDTEECWDSEKERKWAGRFVCDVLVYTLPRCQLPEIFIPAADYGENIYESIEFVNDIGGHVLGISLVFRDGLKWLFQSLRKKCELEDDNGILELLVEAFRCFALATENMPMNSLVIRAIAVCSELLLFLYTEGVPFDINLVISSTSMLILRANEQLEGNLLNTLQEIYLRTDSRLIERYIPWLYDFIEKFHITYPSQDDVSDVFSEEFTKLITEYLKSNDSEVMQTVEEVKEDLGFLPSDFASEQRKDPPKDADSALRSHLTDPVESPEPAISAAYTVCGAVAEEDLGKTIDIIVEYLDQLPKKGITLDK